MKTKIEKLPKSEIEIEIEVSAEEFQPFVDKVTNDFSKNLKIDGFREGKVPEEIIEKEIDKDKIFREAKERAIKDKYLQAISENNIEPVSSPEITILKLVPGNPLIFKARFPILPEVHLPDYKKIASSCKKREIQVKEEEIEKALSDLQRSRAKFSQISRPAKTGDFVEIEFSSPQLEMGQSQKDGFLLGQGHLIPGFEEKLEGMAAGEEKNFSLKFPEKHFQRNLANQEINFKVKMESVKLMELPEVNDQFTKSLGNFENLSSLKQNIKEGLRLEKEILEKQRIREKILREINNNINLDIPEALIEAEKNRQLEILKANVTSQLKISFEEYLKRTNKSEEELKNSFPAKEGIQNFLILREISKSEGIKVSEKEIESEINKMLKRYPGKEKADNELAHQNFEKQNLGGLDPAKLKSYYEEAIRNEKTLQFLENFIQK